MYGVYTLMQYTKNKNYKHKIVKKGFCIIHFCPLIAYVQLTVRLWLIVKKRREVRKWSEKPYYNKTTQN